MDRFDDIDRILKDKMSGMNVTDGLPDFDELFPETVSGNGEACPAGNTGTSDSKSRSGKFSFATVKLPISWKGIASAAAVLIAAVTAFSLLYRDLPDVHDGNPVMSTADNINNNSANIGVDTIVPEIEVVGGDDSLYGKDGILLAEASDGRYGTLDAAVRNILRNAVSEDSFERDKDTMTPITVVPVTLDPYELKSPDISMPDVSEVRKRYTYGKSYGKKYDGADERTGRKKDSEIISLDYDGEKKTGRWGLSALGIASNYSSSEKTSVVMANDKILSNSTVSFGSYDQHVELEGADLHHKYPISAGVLFNYDFYKGLGVETGLIYSYMESKSETFNKYTYQVTQRVHYLGIPVYLTYSFRPDRIVNPYVNAGVMAEFVADASSRLDVKSQDKLIKTETEHIEAPGAIFSLHFGAGLNFRVMEHMGIFAEPGVSCYFANASHPSTYNTFTPLQFRFKLGFRFSF